MKTFDVQAVSLHVSQQQAFAFIADAKRLPDWAQAFASVDEKRALMRTPSGEVEIDLDAGRKGVTREKRGQVVYRA